MHRLETKIEKEVEIVRNKPRHWTQSMKTNAEDELGNTVKLFLSNASAIFGIKSSLSI
jgi:hypothetical protein